MLLFQVWRAARPQLYSCVFLLTIMLVVATAQDPPCSSEADTFVGNAQSKFRISDWMGRGVCVRAHGSDGICYQTLLAVLSNLNELRKSEYGGAAGVLALLPTVGALFGAPTNEIWILLTILPFGGILAMALSFGGAIMPVQVEDYEHAVKKRDDIIGEIVSFRSDDEDPDQHSDERNIEEQNSQGQEIQEHPTVHEVIDPQKPRRQKPHDKIVKKLDRLEQKLGKRIFKPQQQKPGKRYLSLGLLGMLLLFLASQCAMVVLEQGGVLPWWCTSRWWMHLWYFMVTLTAVVENYAQLPFANQRKLYVSRVAYKISLTGGEPMVDSILTVDKTWTETLNEAKNVKTNLGQLNSLSPAKVEFLGSTERTEARNAVLVMISEIDHGKKTLASFWRLLSKSTSIAVFITGTAMFAAVTLVSIPMAVMVLTLVLSAGVFGRAVAGWMVRKVAEEEPMIHVIVDNETEAYLAVCRIFKLRSEDGMDVQVEIDGQVFINGIRVGARSSLHVTILGVLASPYDLSTLLKRRANNKTAETV